MEVMIPSPNRDFDFNSARSSPHVSAPSTPKRFGEYYFSAPTSPSHLTQLYNDFDDFFSGSGAAAADGGVGVASAVPFGWEEKPGTPKSPARKNNGDDFAFDVGRDWETESVSAEELFDGGVIKPLKPPPPMQIPPPARKSAGMIIQGAFSPRRGRNKEIDPFAVAAQNAAKTAAPPARGRERGVEVSKSASRRAARSLSPLRDTQYPWEETEQKTEQQSKMNNSSSSSSSSSLSSALSASTKGLKKWSLKDLFLFRSASEGRAAEKDPLKKYTAALRHSSFRAGDVPGSRSGSRRRGPVSAHEMHYKANRAASEDLKKKTFLPYKQGILGRLSFNPAVHALANGFGFSRK